MFYASNYDENGPLPVAVIGAGPVGLAAAAHLVERGIQPLVLEQSDRIAASLRDWGHVRVFSPWEFNLDAAAVRLLEAGVWSAPDATALPTGGEIVRGYLEPLAAHPALAPHIRTGTNVTAITRRGLDKLTSPGREAAPFELRCATAAGEQRMLARAVIDASGTWRRPNPIGVDGLPVPGEAEAAARIAYGLPDVLGRGRSTYEGRRVLVVGGGHSAINVVLDLLRLKDAAPQTQVFWGLRRARLDRLAGGSAGDQLPERGALGSAAMAALSSGRIELLAPLNVEAIAEAGGGLRLGIRHKGRAESIEVDRIVVATGFRPDLSLFGELRVALDPAVEAPHALAPLIDPNLHSCGTVPPHGEAELAHPEAGFYIAGSKSYGRAPTFLMATGYEQVRSIAAALAGDVEAARDVRLVLPETGVCITDAAPDAASVGCCGGPAPASVAACCAADADAKADGLSGCGCPKPTQATVSRSDEPVR